MQQLNTYVKNIIWLFLGLLGACQPPVPSKAQESMVKNTVQNDFKDLKISGLSFVAPPRPFTKTPMMDVKAVQANWIAVIPYGFTRPGVPKVHYKGMEGHWWGERLEGVRTTIDSAQQAGIRVMLKPQVYVPGGWTGGLDFAADADWASWEQSYEEYLMPFAQIAAEKKIDMLCIGTEFKMSVGRREAFWRQLIAKVRTVYKGKIVYAANWDEYPLVPFWDALDYVGIDAYFNLIPDATPSVSDLKKAWKPHFEAIKAFHQKVNKPVLFTEFGYLSVDGCAGAGWEVEKKVRALPINQVAQAQALEALFATFWPEKWWHGGFLWKWFPEGQGHEGYFDRDYTPQGKQAENILRKWYGH